MALPYHPNPISFRQIMDELGTGARDLESLINLSRLSDKTRPHSMSQFHGYVHQQEPNWVPVYTQFGCFMGMMEDTNTGMRRSATMNEMYQYHTPYDYNGNQCPSYAIE